MPGNILPISAPALAEPFHLPAETRSPGVFRDALAAAIQQVESSGQSATATVERFLSGDGEELHTAILATQRAELAFEMFLQARNKVISAYQEIMRMQM
jgi:flagellar hook-basal body complex protein FliE